MAQTLDDRIVDERRFEDRRDTVRMPQPGGCGRAKLRIGSKVKEVDVLDESAGGFLISIDERLPKLKPTTQFELTNTSGRHPLILVWRRNVGGATRLGLQRLPQHMAWGQDSSWVIWMLVAIILGFGIGYYVAMHPDGSMESASASAVESARDATPIPVPTAEK